jgi:large subunit ribosomal protein LP0
MSGGENKAARKQAYFGKLIKLLDEYPNIFIVGADNVGSAQMAKIRHALRGKAVLLMGKNTMIRKAIRGHIENNKDLENILPYVRYNVGFVFAKDDMSFVAKKLTELKVAAPAKAGIVAPCDVTVPAGPTGMEPTQTSFLQALNIPSKITRGQVEIISDVALIKKGQKVGASECNLLAKLDIKPFAYGLVIKTVYEKGTIYDASILEITDEYLLEKFNQGLRNIASVSLALHYPTVASVPHSIVNGYKNVIAIGLATAYTFPKADAFLKASSAPAPAAKTESKAPAKETKKAEPEPEPEEDGDLGFDMFG